jgi:hypothetical protein
MTLPERSSGSTPRRFSIGENGVLPDGFGFLRSPEANYMACCRKRR